VEYFGFTGNGSVCRLHRSCSL